MKGQLNLAEIQDSSSQWAYIELEEKDSCVSDALRFLLQKDQVKVRDLARNTGISENTLYAITGRKSDRASMHVLKKLADYFQVDVSIFCGYKNYKPPKRLSEKEQELLNLYGGLTDAARRRVEEMMQDIYGNPNNRRKQA